MAINRESGDLVCIKQVFVSQHLVGNSPPCKPTPVWWLIIMAVSQTLKVVNPVIQGLQGLTTLLSEQETSLSSLISNLCNLADVEGPLSPSMIEQKIATGDYVAKERFAVSRKNTRDFLSDLGSAAIGFINCIDNEDETVVINAVSEMLLSIVNGVHNVIGGNDGNTLRAENVAAILPHHLARLRPRHVSTQVRKQRERLLTSFSEAAIDEIEIRHQDLVLAYQKEITLKACLDKCTACSAFEDAWNLLGERFTLLRDFAGGLSTVFPRTAAVESDFSIIKWEKDECRSALTEFSLEVIMHCKQYRAILKL
jgi:hypothetical protein